jgi:hypothetical protein
VVQTVAAKMEAYVASRGEPVRVCPRSAALRLGFHEPPSNECTYVRPLPPPPHPRGLNASPTSPSLRSILGDSGGLTWSPGKGPTCRDSWRISGKTNDFAMLKTLPADFESFLPLEFSKVRDALATLGSPSDPWPGESRRSRRRKQRGHGTACSHERLVRKDRRDPAWRVSKVF